MTSMSIRIDENLKEEFQRICADLGMDMTTAITVFMKQTTREKRIPFEIAMDPFYSPDNIIRLSKAMQDIEKGLLVEHETVEVI